MCIHASFALSKPLAETSLIPKRYKRLLETLFPDAVFSIRDLMVMQLHDSPEYAKKW